MAGVIAAYAEYLGASKPFAGFTAGLYGLVAIFASPLAGLVVDKFGRKKSLIVGLAWDSILVYLYSIVVNPLQLVLVRGLHAIGGSLVYPFYGYCC